MDLLLETCSPRSPSSSHCVRKSAASWALGTLGTLGTLWTPQQLPGSSPPLGGRGSERNAPRAESAAWGLTLPPGPGSGAESARGAPRSSGNTHGVSLRPSRGERVSPSRARVCARTARLQALCLRGELRGGEREGRAGPRRCVHAQVPTLLPLQPGRGARVPVGVRGGAAGLVPRAGCSRLRPPGAVPGSGCRREGRSLRPVRAPPRPGAARGAACVGRAWGCVLAGSPGGARARGTRAADVRRLLK